MVARRVRTAWLVSAVCLLLTAIVVPMAGAGRALTTVAVALPQVLAAVAVFLRSRQESGGRAVAWGLVGVAIVGYAWTSAFYIADPRAAAHFPGIGDASVITYPSMLAATVLFTRARARRGVGWLLLDAGIAGLALAALAEWLLIAPRIGGASVGLATYGQVVYAAGDTFLLGFVLGQTLLVEWPPARGVAGLASGLAVMAAADTAFAVHVAGGMLMPSRFTQLGWAVAMVALAASAITTSPRPPTPPLRMAAVIVPASAAVIAVPVLMLWRPGDDVARLVIATLATVLAGLRLSLSLFENTRLLVAARADAARQAALAELGRRALIGRDLDALFDDAAKLAAEAVGVEFAAVVEHEEPEDVRMSAGQGLAMARGDRFGGGGSLLAALSGEPVVVEDWRTETRFEEPEEVRRQGVRSSLVVAIPSRGPRTWALGVGSREPRSYTAADAAFLEALASVLASATDRLDTAEELQRLAGARGRLVVDTLESEERERRRIAEGLHDLALQELLAARQELDEIRADGSVQVTRAREGLLRAAVDLRETVTELHPVVLEHAGLERALDAAAHRQSERAGFAYTLEVDAEAARGREEVLVSLARELLTNVARHAGASQVALRVFGTENGVALEVRDDGRGVDPVKLAAARRGGHIGLASWTERIEAIGGTITVSSAGGGTCVRAEIPRLSP